MKRLNRYAGVLALCALVVSVMAATIVGANAAGVFITTKQIKNGTIITQDIHKGGVKSSDVANGTVTSTDVKNSTLETQDIGAGEVTPSDITAPEPEQVAVTDALVAPVTGDLTSIMVVDTYAKQSAESVLEVQWVGTAKPVDSNGCVFQLRVNGVPASSGASGEVYVGQEESVMTAVQFEGLPAEKVTIEVWAKNLNGGPTPTTCVIGPAGPGESNIDQSFNITELIV